MMAAVIPGLQRQLHPLEIFLKTKFSSQLYCRPIESPVKVTSLWFEEPIAERQTKTHIDTQGNL